jgi:hypothetical protein
MINPVTLQESPPLTADEIIKQLPVNIELLEAMESEELILSQKALKNKQAFNN